MVGRFLGVDDWGTFWHLTAQSSRIMFENSFGSGNVTIQSYGNVLTSISFLHGLVVEDQTKEEMDYQDERFEVLVGIRAVKAPAET